MRINQGRLLAGLRALVVTVVVVFADGGDLWAQAAATKQSFKNGDALRLTIWQPWQIGNGKGNGIDINGDYAIDNRGYTFLPLIGDVRVIGHNSSTLAADLKDRFSPYIQDPIVVVKPLIRVTMLGAFRRPGTYLVPPDASLWQLVDLAGGPRDDSNLAKMSVERGGKVVKKKLLGGFERGYTLREIGISSGDQVLVPVRKKFRVKDAFEIFRFGVSIINLYFIIQKF